jgi:DNA-binding NarL/FixJ family response regulator
MPTALIVEASRVMRAQLRKLLDRAGFAVVAESDHADNLLALYEHYRPDLVTLAIVLPGRDGTVAAAELLAAHPDAAVVVCSSLSAQARISACEAMGVRSYLMKPFEPEHAIAVFRQAVGAS